MKKKYDSVLRILMILVLAALPILMFAQDEEDTKEEPKKAATFERHFYINGNFGLSLGHADVSNHLYIPAPKTWRPGLGGNFGYQLFPWGGVRLQGSYQWINGNKRKMPQWGNRDVEYKAWLFDYHIVGTLSFTNLLFGYKERAINFYGIFGFGQAQFHTVLFDVKTDKTIRYVGGSNHTYPKNHNKGLGEYHMVWSIPAGLGFAFRVNEKFDITLESQFKWLDTEALDATKVKRDVPFRNDMYSYTSLGLTYKFIGGGQKNMIKKYDEVGLKATPDPLVAKGDSVEITVTGTFPPKYFDKNTAMCFQPKLVYDGGELLLDPITIKGEDVPGDGTPIKYQSGGTFSYTQKVPYSPELNNSELVVDPIVYPAKAGTVACDQIGENGVALGSRKLADGVIYTSKRIMNDQLVAFAEHGYEKETIITEKAKLFFMVNRYNLNWRVPLNKNEDSKKALAMVSEFIAKGWAIKDIQIDGWASPEGEETFNNDLSEKRANTTYNYMLKEIKKLIRAKDSKLTIEDAKEEITFNIKWHGPDWNGFLKNVENSNIKDKSAIMNVINSAGQSKKEEEISNMILIYPELEEYLLPPLRNARIAVNSYQPKKTDEDIKAFAVSEPTNLCIKELMYGATMYEGSTEKRLVYEAVMVQYPDNWLGFNNAGGVEVEMGNIQAARELFLQADELSPNNGIVLNNLGVVSCYMEDYKKAEEYFNKAKAQGINENYNLGTIEILKGNYGQAAQMLSAYNCNYNKGLAQLMNGSDGLAENTLKCAPENAETFYLLAVVGARTKNTSMMYENLSKAFEANPAYKGVALGDKEFVKYYTTPEFVGLVK
ncbi:hypothetical protein ACFLRY_04445 [Bacteroidota bacterium]